MIASAWSGFACDANPGRAAVAAQLWVGRLWAGRQATEAIAGWGYNCPTSAGVRISAVFHETLNISAGAVAGVEVRVSTGATEIASCDAERVAGLLEPDCRPNR